MRNHLLFSCIALLLAACHPEVPLPVPPAASLSDTTAFRLLWQKLLQFNYPRYDAGAKVVLTPFGIVTFRPLTQDSTLVCRNPATGSVIWSSKIVDEAYNRIVYSDNFILIFANEKYSGTTKILCFDAQSGQQQWLYEEPETTGYDQWPGEPIVLAGFLLNKPRPVAN